MTTDYDRLYWRMLNLAAGIEYVAQQLRDVDDELQRSDAYGCAARWLREALDQVDTMVRPTLPVARNDRPSGPCNESATAFREWQENRLDAQDRAFERRYRR